MELTQPSSATHPTIEVSENPAKEAGRYLNDLLSLHINKPVLFLVAGGSSLDVLEYILPEFIPENLTITVTDERFTDDMDQNNFDVLQSTKFYSDVSEVESSVINTAVFAGDDLDFHAARFEKNLREWIAEFPNGKIIALYGIGADGHTAGIIPHVYEGDLFEQKFNSDSLVATVLDKAELGGFPERVTTTFSFMKKVHFPIFYAKGEGKRIALQNALKDDTKLSDTPAHIIKELKGAILFTDLKDIA